MSREHGGPSSKEMGINEEKIKKSSELTEGALRAEEGEDPGVMEKILRGMNNKTVKKAVATIAFIAAMGSAGRFAERLASGK